MVFGERLIPSGEEVFVAVTLQESHTLQRLCSRRCHDAFSRRKVSPPREILDEIFYFLFLFFRVFLFANNRRSPPMLEGVEESALELAERACPYVRPDGLEEQAVLVRVVAVCVTLVDDRVHGENRRESAGGGRHFTPHAHI
jgi:hypothetical protein